VYRKVLVPLDGSDLAAQVLPYAQRVAVGLNLLLELLYVFDANQFLEAVEPRRGVSMDQMLRRARQEATEYLEQRAAPLKEAGLQVVWEVIDGPPALRIQEEA
jgi:nucleotide-binding universal stress UspA family protein